MKKLKLTLIGLVCMMSAGTISAMELTGASNPYRMTDCALLANDIRIMLTSGVVGAIQCNTDTNIVALSVCHTSGLTSSRSSEVEVCVEEGTPDESCGMEVQTVSGSAFPSASTARGTVSSRFPEAACTVEAGPGIADALATTIAAGTN